MKDYIATEADLNAVKEALSVVWKPELDFIFSDRKLIQPTVVVSYDSKHLYLWVPFRGKLGQYRLQKIPHNLSIPDNYQMGWAAGTYPDIEKSLPERIRNSSGFVIPKINGSLISPFIASQKNKKLLFNPYVTRESYLATIVHEFGHIYWQQHKLWWYSNKKENLRYLQLARLLYSRPKVNVSNVPLCLPSIHAVGEIYAFCAEYTASALFWPVHYKNCDKFIQWRLKNLLDDEAKTDLDRVDSVLETTKYPHDFSFVFGKIILTRYPKLWPKILTRRPLLVD